MNKLPSHKQEALKALLEAGGSLRMAVRKLGIHKNTVVSYRKQMAREIYCQCGQPVTHKGFCPFRFQSDGYEERRKFMKAWHGSKNYHCVYCGKGRPGIGGSAGMHCADCYKEIVRLNAFRWAAQVKDCKICGKENHRDENGKLSPHCLTEWCERLYAFYYLEGRSRPPLARGGKNNGLRFDYLLSDFLKRSANEISTR